ncbi:UreD urease accessory protein-domain-containing protein [Leucosporidium creatinivorum]|uniref:UreD urease accessory protein-domain-containing protein n=1 Tax=Leucosporidium creatinivorum TaxID=106004 RepID=A0A1Y2DA98_9BASI|nr:UreD urease accessory protein-domain-containing protein [Leucosporidium creatinivorum]
MLLPTRRLAPGEGVVKLARAGQQAVFETVKFSYPLKLIVPKRHFMDGLNVLYMISYGGGLVAGDQVVMHVEVEKGATLVLLTQGSTKVFKTRPGRFLTATPLPDGTLPTTTRQLLHIKIHPSSTLILLPSPVTCFSKANYAQRQTFDLGDETSNLLLLDWYTSGRMGMKGGGEEWDFTRYRSENEVRVAGRRVAKDVLLLEDEDRGDASPASSASSTPPTDSSASPPPHRTSYLPRVAPYSSYCTLLIRGSLFTPLLQHLSTSFTSITQYKQTNPYSLVWSFSPLEKGGEEVGGIARCAGDSTESVKRWVQEVLKEGGIEKIVGEDLWKNAFSS